MRLTLRTLLAYLDDTLEPAQAKEIGRKIAESPTAQELIARIKEVVRRRRLTTPPETGAGARLDANTIAEYIDSELPPEQLAQVEEVALESDVYLAEIAACHQVLTIVLSRPYIVPTPARQRMYGLIQGREAIPYRRPTRRHIAPGPGEPLLEEGVHHADETLLLGLPLYRGEGSWARRILPVVVVVLLAGALGWALWEAWPGASARPAGTAVAHNERVSEAAAPTHPAPEATPPAAPREAPSVPPTAPAPAKQPETGATSKTAAPTQPPEPKPSETAPPTPTPAPANPPAQAPEPSAQARSAGHYVLQPGDPTVLLTRASGGDAWRRLVRDQPVQAGDQLLSLPGYRSEVRFDSGVQVVLWGDVPDGRSPVVVLESEATLTADPGTDVSLTLERGRISVANHKVQGPANVRVRFARETWNLSLAEPGTELALELVGSPGASSGGSNPSEPVLGLGLYVLRGQAYVKTGYVTHLLREPPGPALFIWSSLRGASAAPQNLTAEQMPPWSRRLPPQGKDALAMRAAEDTLATRLLAVSNIDVSLRESLRGQDAALRVLSLYSLGALDDVAALVDALASERFANLRLAAVTAVMHWVGLAAGNDARLHDALTSAFGPATADIIQELLRPYTEAQRRQPETYETLIAYLRHGNIAVRQLAHLQLSWMVPQGRQISYDPAAGASQRDAAFQKWKKLVPSGKLPPPPQPG